MFKLTLYHIRYAIKRTCYDAYLCDEVEAENLFRSLVRSNDIVKDAVMYRYDVTAYDTKFIKEMREGVVYE